MKQHIPSITILREQLKGCKSLLKYYQGKNDLYNRSSSLLCPICDNHDCDVCSWTLFTGKVCGGNWKENPVTMRQNRSNKRWVNMRLRQLPLWIMELKKMIKALRTLEKVKGEKR